MLTGSGSFGFQRSATYIPKDVANYRRPSGGGTRMFDKSGSLVGGVFPSKEKQNAQREARQRSDRLMGMAEESWDRYREGVDRANEETREDREDILGRLESYEEGYNEDWMSSVLSREKATWDAKREQTIQRVQQQYAARGRQPSPFLMGELNRRLVAQEADALQTRRFELEQERDMRRQWAMQLRNQIYSDTVRRTMDPQAAAQIMTSLGQAASTVQARQT